MSRDSGAVPKQPQKRTNGGGRRSPARGSLAPSAGCAAAALNGVWGMNIPVRYGGLGAPLTTIIETIRTLARKDPALPAIVSSHMRGASYLIGAGTEVQRQRLLPKLARGEIVAAHGCSEKIGAAGARLAASIERRGDGYILQGCKHWVTNAAECDLLVVVAQSVGGGGLSAVLVPRERFGEIRVTHLERQGMREVSLCEVAFEEFPIDPSHDIVGGLASDVSAIVAAAKPAKFLNFAARAVGFAEAIDIETRRILSEREGPAHPVALHRFGGMRARLFALQAALSRAIGEIEAGGAPSLADAMAVRLFATRALLEIVDECTNLLGGSGYASPRNVLERFCRDATALVAAGIPLDRVSVELGALSVESAHE